jgi:hypothetical protein
MSTKQDAERKDRAEAHFRAREILKADAAKATEDYRRAQQKTLERTRKLREQRLAREGQEASAD